MKKDEIIRRVIFQTGGAFLLFVVWYFLQEPVEIMNSERNDAPATQLFVNFWSWLVLAIATLLSILAVAGIIRLIQLF